MYKRQVLHHAAQCGPGQLVGLGQLAVHVFVAVGDLVQACLLYTSMAVVEEFMNIHIATNIGLTIVLFLLVYGSYFLATYLSCKRIVTRCV